MNKTALELTPEEWKYYQLDDKTEPPNLDLSQRREKAWKLAQNLADLLRSKYQAKQVIIFGSLTDPNWFDAYSDIDLAVWGISAEQFYQAVGMVTGISDEFKVDLIDGETCQTQLREIIEKKGIKILAKDT
ncbi:nucleotidyltransferase family protein [Aphanothece sacrum]|uniref:DNA polymerase III subunit beta n=1 Tax=Aphanothece sacrum FPU1 TaxID=1920663 RepID=A0A401IDM2_APHSA|nr:nucleotidyltransferase domain-containing protein [Aphanothece sacrum]GBF79365.1 DNA polymerase III subunit beta [Aphanothece sacrum FPU1]GBF86866.1 DNA polymerase III subunit beta [Aphanothece sacrum FPU3]